jgi:hypothetical protein
VRREIGADAKTPGLGVKVDEGRVKHYAVETLK